MGEEAMNGRGIVLVALLAGACTHLPGTATMEADPSEIGIEGLALINELSKAYTKLPETIGAGGSSRPSVCSYALPSFQESGKYTYSRYNSDSEKTHQKFKCIAFRSDPTTVEVDSHLRAGFALSDYFCDNFFRRVARRTSERRFVRNGLNDVGAAVSAVLGLAKAGSGVTGGIGAGFGLFDATFRNYEDSFLVTSDLPRLQGLVQTNQYKYRQQVEAIGMQNYADATTAIIRYANYCSFVGMKDLLNETIEDSISASDSYENAARYRVEFATTPGRVEAEIAEKELEYAKRREEARKKKEELEAEDNTQPEGVTDVENEAEENASDDGEIPPPSAAPPPQ